MSTTSIQWTDRTVNPVRARNKATGAVGHFCEKVSAGCTNCYASSWNERVRPITTKTGDGHLIGTGLTFDVRHRDQIEFFLDDSKLLEVLKRRTPTKWFWCDMTDMFGDWVPDEWIDRCFAVMAMTPWHTHQVLTKRAERMREYGSRLPNRGCNQFMSFKGYGSTSVLWGHADLQPWPLPNVWVGVSVENQDALERIDILKDTPAAIRFVSFEPLLEDLNALILDGIHWAIVGGESGLGARPMDLAWARSIVQQCQAAGVACFVKQLGAKAHYEHPRVNQACRVGVECEHGFDVCPTCDAGIVRVNLRDRKGGDPSEWPEDLRVREWPEARQ